MAKTAHERLLEWLRDAYAMEQQAETLLKSQAERLEHYPEMQQRVRQHLQETQSQSQRLEERIRQLDGDLPGAKSALTQVMAAMQSVGTMAMDDEAVKGLGIAYAFEHMEIVSYRNLRVAAELAGDVETVRLCDKTLPEEIAMADWLLGHQASLVTEFVRREQVGDEGAKR